MQEIYKQLKQFGKVKINELMAKHTTFQIGGSVDFLITVESSENLIGLLNFLSEQEIEYYILGGGSNLLWQDERYEGVVIKVQSSEFRVQGDIIIVDSGAQLGMMVNTAMQNGLIGMEWAIGIPGTIGGAVRGNAGAMGDEMASTIEKVEVWQNGEVFEMTKEECGFYYRGSAFKDDKSLVVLRVWLKLKTGEKQEIFKKMQELFTKRTSGIFPEFPSAGSFFKNINLADWPGDKKILLEIFIERGKIPVGWLVEQCNLKGYTVGGAKVSDEHGNFIVNFKNATQADVLAVVEKVKEEVYNRFKVELEEEVEIIK